MSDKRANLEVIAPTVEEAIAKGLSDLGLPEEAVEVEVLDEGSRGLFGLGSRHARIRITIKAPAPEADLSPKPSKASLPVPQPESPTETLNAPAAFENGGVSTAPSPKAAPAAVVEPDETADEERENDEDFTLRVSRETVSELLTKMRVKARVTSRYGEAEDARSKTPILVSVNGNDLSILIGRQAETLNALQYITNLIISKELGKNIPVIIDVEGYRQRREQQIRQLARRMADQAIKTGRRQVLEPMPANERRLIHIELRDNPGVTTESVGEDPRRKVTIIPKVS